MIQIRGNLIQIRDNLIQIRGNLIQIRGNLIQISALLSYNVKRIIENWIGIKAKAVGNTIEPNRNLRIVKAE